MFRDCTTADDAGKIARECRERMRSNDVASVAPLLSADFVHEWPQTGERIRGAGDFVRMNAEYPAHGPGRFTIHRLAGGTREAVSDVGITDGVLDVRAITFFEVADGRVPRIVEWRPEPYAAPAKRAHRAGKMDWRPRLSVPPAACAARRPRPRGACVP